ncbi:inovirus-type Gp2 protein [Pseudoalteromonas sp. SR41-4]|nr:inovirus-type Gp2 protein [Pseudoalteromonas sp. SR41-4]MBB1292374.1 inovirus Gp2 family protein [Pseudoalteromonas sp. SR41-4]
MRNINLAINPYNEKQAIYWDHWLLIRKALKMAQDSYPRLSVIRFDLRITDIKTDDPNIILDGVMKRFFTSLQSKIKHNTKFKAHAKTQCLRYVWVKEKGNEKDKEHFHICIFLNKDDFGFIGQYRTDKRENKKVINTLRESIVQSWATALKVELMMAERLVYFGKTPLHWLDRKRNSYSADLENVKKRLCYMAKVETKEFEGRKIGVGKYLIYKPKSKKSSTTAIK